jgi:hypothetical protein
MGAQSSEQRLMTTEKALAEARAEIESQRFAAQQASLRFTLLERRSRAAITDATALATERDSLKTAVDVLRAELEQQRRSVASMQTERERWATSIGDFTTVLRGVQEQVLGLDASLHVRPTPGAAFGNPDGNDDEQAAQQLRRDLVQRFEQARLSLRKSERLLEGENEVQPMMHASPARHTAAAIPPTSAARNAPSSALRVRQTPQAQANVLGSPARLVKSVVSVGAELEAAGMRGGATKARTSLASSTWDNLVANSSSALLHLGNDSENLQPLPPMYHEHETSIPVDHDDSFGQGGGLNSSSVLSPLRTKFALNHSHHQHRNSATPNRSVLMR